MDMYSVVEEKITYKIARKSYTTLGALPDHGNTVKRQFRCKKYSKEYLSPVISQEMA